MRIRLCILLSLLATIGLAAIAFWWAPLNQDEGWYLMAARRVSQGQMPYRDFAFTQAPLFPYVFQFAQPLIKTFGLAGGRLFQFFWFGMTFWVLLWNCKKSVPKAQLAFASLIVISLLGLNVFQLQYTATVKTYTLAGYFLSLAMLGWLSYQRNARAGTLILSALALAAAAATRLSLGLFFVPLGCSLLASRKEKGDQPWILFAAAGLIGLSIAFLPFFLSAPEGFRFGLFQFHAARQVDSILLLKAGFLSRMIQSYFPALLLFLLLLLKWKTWQPGLRSMGLGIGAVTLLHLLAPFPYDDYQVALYPVLVLLIAIEGSHQLSETKQHQIAPLLLTACLLFAFSSPQLPTWFSHGQDRIWWKTKATSDLHLLRETARIIKEIAPQATELFTTDTYLAIETGLEIPEDMEMGPFSYFPDLETNKAEQLHVLNTQRLMALIQNTQAPVAALSGYSFSIESPTITPTSEAQRQAFIKQLEMNFQPFALVEHFGQGPSTLTILVHRNVDIHLKYPIQINEERHHQRQDNHQSDIQPKHGNMR